MHTIGAHRGVIREGFAADASAYLHAMWMRHGEGDPLTVVHGIEVLPRRALDQLPEGWAVEVLDARARRERLTAVPATSWDWAARQKMRYPGALRSARALLDETFLQAQSQRAEGLVVSQQPFSFETVLVDEPLSIRIAPRRHLVSAGLRLDVAAFRSWMGAMYASEAA